jgi:hypothetical protein
MLVTLARMQHNQTELMRCIYIVLCMPWFRWCDPENNIFDGAPRYNKYINSKGEMVLDLPLFMAEKADTSKPYLQQLGAGPYAFS